MAWAYSDWATLGTAAARKARLALHIQEVADMLQRPQSVNSGAEGMSRHDLLGYQEHLVEQYREEEKRDTSGGVARLRIRGGR